MSRHVRGAALIFALALPSQGDAGEASMAATHCKHGHGSKPPQTEAGRLGRGIAKCSQIRAARPAVGRKRRREDENPALWEKRTAGGFTAVRDKQKSRSPRTTELVRGGSDGAALDRRSGQHHAHGRFGRPAPKLALIGIGDAPRKNPD